MMDHAITVGDLVTYILWAGGIVIVLSVAVYILAAIGKGFSR